MASNPINKKIKRRVEITTGKGLDQIAHQELGDFRFYREIAQLNNLGIFDPLPIGSFLFMPGKEELPILDNKTITTRAEGLVRTLSQGALPPELDLSSVKQGDFAFRLISWIL